MGAALKKARLAAQMTQIQLARETGIGQSQISTIENGNYKKDITANTLLRLGRALGIDPEALKFGRIVRRTEQPGEMTKDVAGLDVALNKVNRQKWIAYGEGLLAAQIEESKPRPNPVLGFKRKGSA